MGFLKGLRQWLRMNKQEMELKSLAIGMNSSVDITQDLHIIMLDYDVEDIALVEESVKELQEFWRLGEAEIFRTKHGYHVFFWFNIVPYGRLKMIIEYAKFVDPLYKYISRFYNHRTIRVAGKYDHQDIVFVKVIKSKQYVPTAYERDIGSMKREEHRSLREGT